MATVEQIARAVEAAAQANYERHYRTGRKWDELDDQRKESARDIVRPVVEAAIAALDGASSTEWGVRYGGGTTVAVDDVDDARDWMADPEEWLDDDWPHLVSRQVTEWRAAE